ncbi:MAG TPA: NAD-dependent epimerase/dehydratase family protein [Acidimicrobiales bacterium]|nr:NAD-dependent epimerase/dehydratase family protein [Acidimicrobiales bacterium]
MTGAAGFIGRHLSSGFLAGGHEVVGVDSYTDYYDPARKRANAAWLAAHDGFTEVERDLVTDPIDEILDGADAVVHLAGQPGVRLSWADGFGTYVDRNVGASQRLLEAARRTRVPRLVLASSSSVYGNAADCPVSEDAPTRPFSPYGVTKLAMEHLAGAYVENWKLPVVMLRYFTVYGPAQRPDMAMHRFIERVGAGEPVPVYGDGQQVRDFTYVGDAAAATVAAADTDLAPGTVLNVAGGSSATINDVLDLVSRCVGREVVVDRLPPQPGDVRVTGGAIDRARALLRWAPEVSLDDGVSHQVAHQVGCSAPTS